MIVMIFPSNNHLLTYLELQNWKTADCEAMGVSTALHNKVKSNWNKKNHPEPLLNGAWEQDFVSIQCSWCLTCRVEGQHTLSVNVQVLHFPFLDLSWVSNLA